VAYSNKDIKNVSGLKQKED